MMGVARIVSLAILAAASSVQAGSVEIHPAGPTIPENLLRFELRFAQAQPLPFDVDRLKLLDANGQPIDNALLDLALPSSDGRRITVLMDPGRVKTGVGPNLDAGRALHAGDTVSLRVEDRVAGGAAVVKVWHVIAASSVRLDPAAWQVTEPRAKSRDPLIVDLRGPVSSSGEALIAVLDAGGRPVRGKTALASGDAVWRFTPLRPWRSGAHQLVVHPDLEDPAGNRRCAAFEQLRGSAATCNDLTSIPFAARSVR